MDVKHLVRANFPSFLARKHVDIMFYEMSEDKYGTSKTFQSFCVRISKFVMGL